MRKLWGVIAGSVAAVIVVFAIEIISHLIYSPPIQVDPGDYAAMSELVKNAPIGALLLVICGHLIATFVGVVISFKITKEKSTAYLVIGIFAILIGMNFYLIQYPSWFVIADIIAVLIGGGIPYVVFKNK